MASAVRSWGRAGIALLALVAGIAPAAAQGTIMPTPYQTVVDTSGKPVSNAKICTFVAGTSTPIFTYSDVGLTVQNANPIRADSGGVFVAYLQPGTSYKFTYQTASGTTGTCDGALIKTVDNVSAVPASAANVDISGVAGEALTAGQVAYLSDGSNSKTAGQWFKADAANTYSSVTALVGLVPNSITSGQTGTIRLTGAGSGLSSLTIGTSYYVGTAGALTSTAPSNRRLVGVADTTTSLVLAANPLPAPRLPNVAQGRLTASTGVCVPSGDVLAATTLYYTPNCGGGNQIALYDGVTWNVRTFTEISIAVPATTSTLYDAFVYDNAGAATLELTAWTSDTVRATALSTQDGVQVRSGAPTRRFVGAMRTTAVSGQTEDSATKRYVWNYYNRAERVVARYESAGSWTYSTATWRQANANAANQIDVVQGLAESPLRLHVQVTATSSSGGGGGITLTVGIGEDSTTATVATAVASLNIFTASTTDAGIATLVKVPTVGRHFYSWLEASLAVGTTTWYGANNVAGGLATASGLFGTWWS